MGCAASTQAKKVYEPEIAKAYGLPAPDVPVAPAKATTNPLAPLEPHSANGDIEAEGKELKVNLDAESKDPKDMSFEDGLQCLQDVAACLELRVASSSQKKVMAFFDNSREALKVIASMTLPPPGGQVVSTAVEIAHSAIQAIFNNENCCQLAKKMADVVHSVWLHHEVLEKEDKLQLVMERLKETQSRVLEFVKRFSTTGFLRRALQYSGDQWKFNE